MTTQAQRDALEWLTKRNGDGCFDRNGVVLAAGQRGPFQRSTWNALRNAGKVEFYGGTHDGGSGHGRIRIATR